MYSPLSSQWDAQIRVSGSRVVRADLYEFGALEPLIESLPVTDISVTTDRRAVHRRTGSLTIVDEELLQSFKESRNSNLFSPFGQEIIIYSGVIHSDSSEELVPLGVFQIDGFEWSDDDAEMEMQLVDRSKILQRREFLFPYSPNGGSAKLAIQTLIGEALPWVNFTISSDLDDVTLPGGVSYSGDYLDAIRALSDTLGAEFFFDTAGVARVEPSPYVPTSMLDSEAVWSINSGDLGVLISTEETLGRNETYNEVIVLGVSTAAGVDQPYAVVRDENTTSRTYYGGPFGRSTLRIQRQELTTSEQCIVVATSTLQNSLGLSNTLSLRNIANPALEEGDIVLIEHHDGRSELHLIDSISFDISGSSSITTRSRAL